MISLGESSKISPESVKMLMTHSAEVVIDDCDQEDARGGGKQKEFQIIQFSFVMLIAQCTMEKLVLSGGQIVETDFFDLYRSGK